MPKISVLMPVYKTDENFLRQAIESILNQTYADFEFLILDDCPEDTREEIVKSYDDKRIKYMKNERNLGITPSRNKLIDMAKGEYLAVMDHDDVSLPSRFEKEVAYLDTHPGVGVISCNIKTLVRGRVSKNPIEDHDIKIALMRGCALVHSAAMIRKSVLTDNNIRYEERFSPSEDYALWCRLIPYTSFYNIEEVLFHYRDHESNTSHTRAEQMTQATYAVWAFAKVENPVLYEEFLLKARHVKYLRLFGFIPFLTIISQGNRFSVYLFEKIKLFAGKKVVKMRG